MSARTVSHSGLLVQPTPGLNGETFYAEIEPASSRWLPWPGRTSRWWYEIHAIGEPDEHGIPTSTLAYLDGGSGGGFTLATCIRRAQEAVGQFAEEGVLLRGGS